MKNILTISLANDMDLILAHKRVMKLCELSGLSLPMQTIFATAVSEIARVALEDCQEARLSLRIAGQRGARKQLEVVISDRRSFCHELSESVVYARRLADEVRLETVNGEMQVILRHNVAMAGLLTDAKIQSFVEYFQNERPISPYDELRRKNLQLEELAVRLRDSEHNYIQLTNALPIMMFTIESGGKVVYTNKWLRDFVGFNITQLNAAQCQPFLHPEDYENLYGRWNRSKEGFAALHSQARLKHFETGQYVWHLVSVLPFKTDLGAVDQWNGFLVDIHAQKLVEQTLQDNTELKHIQQQLEFYQQDLERKIAALNRSNHDLEQFAYIASHDLQEPLRKIRTFVDRVLRDPQNAVAVEKYIAKINAAAERMSLLVQGVLDYSRISNDQELSTQKTDLNEVMALVENDFESLIREKDAVIHRGKLPSLPVESIQLQQIFGNLFSNALKFTQAKPVITISARPLSAEEVAGHPQLKPVYDYTLITFQDNGIGFEPQYNEKIFTIFQQLHTRDAYEGAGIGLALCKKVVERHHGMITANGQPGEGATFWIYLPVN